MPGFLVLVGAQVMCAHAGQAQPTVPNPRVLVSGQPTLLMSEPFVVTDCAFPPPPNGNGPCVSAQWTSGTTRVLKNGQDEKSRVRFAYETALGRPPEKAELEQCRKFLADARARLADSGTPAGEVEAESWRAFIRTLLRLNEFAYVD